MVRVFILGIDGMDIELFSKFKDDLPNINKLYQLSPKFDYRSVYPPDTPTAWASIFTGLNPAKHGILFFVDPLDRVGVTSYEDIDNSAIKNRTFWDIASRNGKKVCIVFPELGFPVWKVNGIMVSKSKSKYGNVKLIDAYPQEMFQNFDLSNLGAIRAVSKKASLQQFLENYRKLIDSELEFSLNIFNKEKWDIFFTYSCGLDWIGHSLWNYFDETDPTYEPNDKYSGVLLEFYKRYDKIVGKYLEIIDDETIFILLSDHGFGRRPTKLVNINKILKEKGLLHEVDNHSISSHNFAEIPKKIAIKYVNQFGAGDIIMKIFHSFPQIKKHLTSPLSIDWDRTIANISDLSGIKSYQYGGIFIKKEVLTDENYEEIRTNLIKELSILENPENGEKLVEWICRREELYNGEYIEKYPDLLFHFTYDYGAGWEINNKLITECKTHSIQPGSHRLNTPILLINGIDYMEIRKTNANLFDIAPTILGLLGIETDKYNFDGESLFIAR